MSKVKTMQVIFFYDMGVVHKEFVFSGQSGNPACYKNVLERLLACESFRYIVVPSWQYSQLYRSARSKVVNKVQLGNAAQPSLQSRLGSSNFFLSTKMLATLKSPLMTLKEVSVEDLQDAYRAEKNCVGVNTK